MKERNAVTLDSRAVHNGRVFQTRSDRVRLPNGRETTMDVVRHPASVILVPMPGSDQVILVRQYRYAVDRWLWELPAGNVEPGEEPETAARRECAEETGRRAAAVDRIGTFYPTPGYCDEEMIFYRLTGLTAASDLALDADEVLDPRTFTLDEARQVVAEAPVADMKTVLGLRLVRR
jgi:ADP-ribose pyrophosphatase